MLKWVFDMKKGVIILLILICLVLVGSYIISNLEITGYSVVYDLAGITFDYSYVWMVNILLFMLVVTVFVTSKIEAKFESRVSSFDRSAAMVVGSDLSYIDAEIDKLRRELG